MTWRYFGLVSLWIAMIGGANAAERPNASSPPPAPPVAEIPPGAKTTLECIGCNVPFDTPTHKKILAELQANPYASELRKALYWQDTYHQFQSKAHFDNCDFDGAMDYIAELLAEVDGHVAAAAKAEAARDKSGTTAAAVKAFFALGQAIHAVQDFYAHSNYVEMQVPLAARELDIPLVRMWRPEGRTKIKALREAGLISGYVFWGFPQKCPDGTMSHHDLAKDSEGTTSGRVTVAKFSNRSRYRIAVRLARDTSLSFMEDAFKRWPLLKRLNGDYILLDGPIDRRGVP